MAVNILALEVSDICLGKPALRALPVTATVGEALSALKRTAETHLSVWSCDHHSKTSAGGSGDCRCVGKVCMVDVICFLCKEENLKSPATALQAPVSVLLPKVPGIVRHLDPNASLLEAIDLILEGAQNLVIPIQSRRSTSNSRKNLLQKPSFNSARHNNREYCWVTQEDIVRYFLNCIGLFSPTPASSINTLNLIEGENILAINYDDPAASALPLIPQALAHQTSVAVVDGEGKLIGEISPCTLNSCDEMVAAAIAVLSAGDLLAYVDCGGPPEDLVQVVKDRLEERNCGALLDLMEEDYSTISSSSSLCSSSSDEEFGYGKSGRLGGNSGRMGRRSEAIVCYPWSSLVAVMIQALAHRLSYAWVVEGDGTLMGIVTFAGMLKIFRERLNPMT